MSEIICSQDLRQFLPNLIATWLHLASGDQSSRHSLRFPPLIISVCAIISITCTDSPSTMTTNTKAPIIQWPNHSTITIFQSSPPRGAVLLFLLLAHAEGKQGHWQGTEETKNTQVPPLSLIFHQSVFLPKTYMNTSCRGRRTPSRSTGQHSFKLLKIKCSSVHIVLIGLPKSVRTANISDHTQRKISLLPQVLRQSCCRDALLTLQLEFMTSVPRGSQG